MEVTGTMMTSAERDDMPGIRPTFLETVTAIRPLVASSEVAERWTEESALPGFSVGGLAGHLIRAALTVDTYLDRPEPEDGKPVSVAAYYANLDPDVSSPFHAGIRQRGEELAAGGQGALVEKLDRLITRLSERLTTEPPQRLMSVAGDRPMRLDEYLITRIVELVVHADDLAVSVGRETDMLSPSALNLTIAALVDVARYRHGDLAVVRALSRRERDTSAALRVF